MTDTRSEGPATEPSAAALLRELESNPDLDPALRESLRASLRAHEEMVGGGYSGMGSFDASTGVSATSSAGTSAARYAGEVQEPVEREDAPRDRRERLAHLPLLFRLRLAKWPLRATCAALLGWLAGIGLLLSACWSGLGGVGQPVATMLWLGGFAALLAAAPYYLQRYVSMPEAHGLSRLLLAFLMPAVVACAAFLAGVSTGLGLGIGVALILAGHRLHRDVVARLQPEAPPWLVRTWLACSGLILASPWLARSPALGSLLAAAWLWYADTQRTRALQAAPVMDTARRLMPSLLVVQALTLVLATVLQADGGAAAKVASLAVMVGAGTFLYWHRVRDHIPKHWRLARLEGGGVAVAVAASTATLVLSFADPVAFGAASLCAAALLASIGWTRRLPLVLLPALLFSAAGFGILLVQALGWIGETSSALVMSLGFLPYLAAVEAAFCLARQRERRDESLILGLWSFLTLGSVLGITLWLGDPASRAAALVLVGLVSVVTGAVVTQRMRVMLGWLAVQAGMAVFLAATSLEDPVRVACMAAVPFSLLASAWLWRRSSRPRIAQIASPTVDSATVTSLALAALVFVPENLAVGFQPGDPVSLGALFALLSCLGLAFGRLDLGLVGIVALARAADLWLIQRGAQPVSAERFGVFAAMALLPVLVRALFRRVPAARVGWPGAAPDSVLQPLTILGVQVFALFAWRGEALDLVTTSVAAGGWLFVAAMLYVSAFQRRSAGTLLLTGLPVAAVAHVAARHFALEPWAAYTGGGAGLALLIAFVVGRGLRSRPRPTSAAPRSARPTAPRARSRAPVRG